MASGLDLGNANCLPATRTPVAGGDSDTALVKLSQEGHRDAFGQLYQRYARMVHGILLAKVPALEAEDLVHEVFLRALPRLHGFARGLPLRRLAGRNYQKYGQGLLSPAARTERVQPTILNRGRKRRTGEQAQTQRGAEILDSVRSLPEAYRETLILRLVEGMTGPEIAAKTGLSHGSVRVNLNRGMQQLREKLGQRRAPASAAEE